MNSLKISIAIMATLGFLGAAPLPPSAANHRGKPGTTFPPSRVPFQHQAPDEVILAKLWWDIGHFSPFTGSISRDAWEKGFFKILNEHLEGRIDLAQAVAETVALLNDPHQLVLAPGEGQGPHFLPAIFEIRDGKPWIIGGDRKQVPAVFGPITSVDGTPVETFLSKRLGSNRSPERIFAAFTLAASQKAPFQSVFGSPKGSLTVSSLDAPAKVQEAWIDGGWKGVRLSEIQEMPPKGLAGLKEKIPALDLRDAHWQLGLVPDPLQTTLILRGASAPDLPVVRIVREHQGVYEADWDRYASDSYSFNRIAAHPAPSRIAWVEKDAPCPAERPLVLLHEHLAEILAGWGLPAHLDTAAETTLLDLAPSLTVRLRTQSWAPGLSDAKHVATYRNGTILSKGAAKALATATILNFDHYYGFTPEHRQAQLFSRMLTIHAEAQTALEVVSRSGWATGDLHGTTGLYLSGELPDPLWETMTIAGVNPTWPCGHLFMVNPYRFEDGSVRFLVSAEGIKAGHILHSINGIPISLISKTAAKSIPHRDETKDPLWSFLLLSNNAFGAPKHVHTYKPQYLTIEVSSSHEDKKIKLHIPAGRPLINDPAPRPPDGWKLFSSTENPPTLDEVLKKIEAGDNIILDARKQNFIDMPWAFSVWELPSRYFSPFFSQSRKTPASPSTWGHKGTYSINGRPNPNPSFSSNEPFCLEKPQNPTLKGRLIIVVDGSVASQNEGISLFLKESFPKNTAIVGTPTGGCIGAMTYVFLYSGDKSSRIIPYSPTVSSVLINGKNIHLAGVPLDYRVSEDEIRKALRVGTSDAVLTSVYSAIKRKRIFTN